MILCGCHPLKVSQFELTDSLHNAGINILIFYAPEIFLALGVRLSTLLLLITVNIHMHVSAAHGKILARIRLPQSHRPISVIACHAWK